MEDQSQENEDMDIDEYISTSNDRIKIGNQRISKFKFFEDNEEEKEHIGIEK